MHKKNLNKKQTHNFVCMYHTTVVLLSVSVYPKYSCWIPTEFADHYSSSNFIPPLSNNTLPFLHCQLMFASLWHLTGVGRKGIVHFAKIKNAQTLVFRS